MEQRRSPQSPSPDSTRNKESPTASPPAAHPKDRRANSIDRYRAKAASRGRRSPRLAPSTGPPLPTNRRRRSWLLQSWLVLKPLQDFLDGVGSQDAAMDLRSRKPAERLGDLLLRDRACLRELQADDHFGGVRTGRDCGAAALCLEFGV